MMTFDLDGYLNERKKLVEAALAAHLDRCEGAPATLREAMSYSLLAGGKRLRPILALAACEAVGGARRTRRSTPACAVEFVHTYSLIHDDLPAMDDDDFRRGRPTSHKKFGEAMAILAGDALCAEAFRVAAQNRKGREERVADVVFELARAVGRGRHGGRAGDRHRGHRQEDRRRRAGDAASRQDGRAAAGRGARGRAHGRRRRGGDGAADRVRARARARLPDRRRRPRHHRRPGDARQGSRQRSRGGQDDVRRSARRRRRAQPRARAVMDEGVAALEPFGAARRGAARARRATRSSAIASGSRRRRDCRYAFPTGRPRRLRRSARSRWCRRRRWRRWRARGRAR